MSLLLQLWPGLAALWRTGDGRGLLAAIAFALLLNGSLLVSFGTQTAYPWWICSGIWGVTIVFWATCLAGRLFDAKALAERPNEREGLLRLAQGQYLKSNWDQAERILRELLQSDASDAEAVLMLATMCRRLERFSEARRYLKQAAELPGDMWQWEIAEEMQRLTAAESQQRAAAKQNQDLQHKVESVDAGEVAVNRFAA